jgi:hypothetical protein
LRRPTPSRLPLGRDTQIVVGIAALVWLALIAGGGSARADVLALVGVRLMAVAGIVAVLLLVPFDRLRFERPVLAGAGIAAALVALQLVPLPHAVWTALPGRAFYDQLASVPEIGALWRPISLAPDLTWNALLSFVPPLFFLIAVPMLEPAARRWLLIALLATILLSGFVGLLQISSGDDSALRWYRITNEGVATGLFANRNHEAVFLAMGIPIAIWWAVTGDGKLSMPVRLAIAASMILFLFISVVTSQSRSGLVIAGLALVCGVFLFLREAGLRSGVRKGITLAMLLAIPALLVASVWLANRPGSGDIEADLRVRVFPETVAAAKAFFPIGAGNGAFPEVFRRFEENKDLRPTYLNHAHNELTEIVIEGGIVSVLLLLAFLLWFAAASIKIWRTPDDRGGNLAMARLATLLLAMPLLASVTDYPVRTPLMACTIAIAVVLLYAATRIGAGAARSPRGAGRWTS